jgi:alpha-galactosidase
MWSVLAAPLIIGSDVSSLSQASIDMLTNPEVLAIDQDPLGKQGTLLSSDADAQVWVRQLADGSRAVALLNRGEAATRISTTAAAVGLRKAAAYGVRNVWTHTTSESAGGISAAVPAHGTVLLRVSAGIDPETAAPLVTLAPLSVPAAYAGSDLHLAVPGSSFTVTSTLTDEGRLPVSGTDVTVDVPDGWTVAPAATTPVGTIPGGRSLPLSWTVHVPADATPGPEPLAVTTHYSWSDGATTHPVTTSTTTGVQVPPPAPTGTADLAHVSWLRATSGWMTPRVDGEVGGGPLRMNGTRYATGIGVASPSDVEYYLGGRCSRLRATVGIDDATNFDSSGGTVDFQVLTDGGHRADTGVVARPDVKTLDVDITGAQVLTLHVGDAGDGGYNDRADWADTTITCS